MSVRSNLSGKNCAWFLIIAVSLFAAAIWTFQSGWRWAHFSYSTFDLAFYVQALDGFSHGRNWSSLLGVQPFGNHADFIILLIWPIFRVIDHPLALVVVQNIALAACLPLGWKIALEKGWKPGSALALAAIFLINPVLTFIAIHEFHPEAFAAPLWLAVYLAWQQKNLRFFWLALVLFLSCKENLGLISLAWCFTKLFERPNRETFWKWIFWPGIFSAVWMAVYLFLLAPKWNAGNVDYGALYSHLREQGIYHGSKNILSSSIQGNLLWALLLPMLLIPLRRTLALLPALPILMQHLLSWRSSEWTIYFHYAAPLLPIFWIATLEALTPAKLKWRSWLPVLLISANLICFFAVGTLEKFFGPFSTQDSQISEKRQIVREIPAQASVLAPLPFQSHLAQRENLFSLHLVLKGLKTLSRERYTPPLATDYVIVDYDDPTTFDSSSGYYHPAMLLKTGQVVPSSDALLHAFLSTASWKVRSKGSLSVWQKIPNQPVIPANVSVPLKRDLISPATDLISISAKNPGGQLQITSRWIFRGDRQKIPWMRIVATQNFTGEKRIFSRGLCCPEGRADGAEWSDNWLFPDDFSADLTNWSFLAIFEDFATRSYLHRNLEPDSMVVINIPVE